MDTLVAQFVQFAAVGAVGTVVHFEVLISFMEISIAGPVASSAVGALCGAVTNYYLNYLLTFRSDAPHERALPNFVLVVASAFVINVALMSVLARGLNFHYLAAQVLTTGIVLLWTFSVNRS